jgi:hypothetical protein
MRYSIELRKDEYKTEKGQTRGTWEQVAVIEADCSADARRVARKKYVGQKWRINRRKSAKTIDELIPSSAAAETATTKAPAAKAKKVTAKGKSPAGKAVKKK